jgi:hypothetical protein
MWRDMNYQNIEKWGVTQLKVVLWLFVFCGVISSLAVTFCWWWKEGWKEMNLLISWIVYWTSLGTAVGVLNSLPLWLLSYIANGHTSWIVFVAIVHIFSFWMIAGFLFGLVCGLTITFIPKIERVDKQNVLFLTLANINKPEVMKRIHDDIMRVFLNDLTSEEKVTFIGTLTSEEKAAFIGTFTSDDKVAFMDSLTLNEKVAFICTLTSDEKAAFLAQFKLTGEPS